MRRTGLLILLVLCFHAAQAQLVINEVMQSNVDCIMDDMNEYPDSWVELYNAGNESVNTYDYYLTDNAYDVAQAWRLPYLMLGAKQHRLVYCDKVGKGWHAPFRLESGKGCTLYLVNKGQIVDQLPYDMKKQPAPNIAFGRKTDGASEWGYQLNATPGKANSGQICTREQILGDPVFSISGRVFTGNTALLLTLSVPKDAPKGTVLRYTDDGSEPVINSKTYNSPINISNTRVIRARLFCNGYLSPPSVTQSYIKMTHKVTLPVISITTDNKNLYDNKMGIYINGTYSNSQKNYEYDWRRPINLEFFEQEDVPCSLNQLCETRIGGRASRGTSLKTLVVYANKRFGEKRFDYEFFPDQRPGQRNFKSLLLRNAGNDFDYLYMRDALIQRHTAAHIDIDWQAWRPAICYINGSYKGILNIRERSNEDNIYTNYDGLEDIDMVENWNELKEGTLDNWNAFQAYYNEHGHTWDDYNEVMDVQQFMNVMIMNLFYCNLDFPGNNFVMWRPRAKGGRWRVVVKDTDFGLGLYDRNVDYRVFTWIYNPNYDSSNNWANGYEHTRLFRRLMEDERFKREFIDRFAIYMGDHMNLDCMWEETWNDMYSTIAYEYPFHRKLYNQWWPVYNDELSKAKNWMKTRVDKMYNQLRDYFKVGDHKPLIINRDVKSDDLQQMQVSINGVQLSRGTLNGRFFIGRDITLEGNECVKGWELNAVMANGAQKSYVAGNTLSIAMPNCYALTINALTTEPDDAVHGVQQDGGGNNNEIFDLNGRRINKVQRGVNIIKGGKKVVAH